MQSLQLNINGDIKIMGKDYSHLIGKPVKCEELCCWTSLVVGDIDYDIGISIVLGEAEGGYAKGTPVTCIYGKATKLWKETTEEHSDYAGKYDRIFYTQLEEIEAGNYLTSGSEFLDVFMLEGHSINGPVIPECGFN